MNEAVRLHSSSGTTGQPTVVVYSEHDICSWANMIARNEHDTITVHLSDTVRTVELKIDSIVDIQTVYVGDTVYRDREHVITLNQNGDTIKEHLHEKQVEKHNEATNTQHNKTSTDSVSYFKAKCDSLQKVINKQHEKHEKVTKTKRPWTDYIIVAAVLAFALFLIRKIP